MPQSQCIQQLTIASNYKEAWWALGWSVEFFLIGLNRSSSQRSGMILEVQIQSFSARAGARTSKFEFSINSRGLKYQYFLVKIGMKLPFTIKKTRNTNLRVSKLFYFTPPKSAFLVFEEKHPNKMFLCVLALIQL